MGVRRKPVTLVGRILFGWFGAAPLIYGAAALVNPLAGLAFLIFLLIGLVVFVGPTAHFILARRAFASGSYKPARIVAAVAAAICGVVLLAAALGAFNVA
jgi:hypothetical protein